MTTIEARSSDLFLRNSYAVSGKYEFPTVRKQSIDTTTVDLISYSDTYTNESETNKRKGVHFFIDDYRFEGIYLHPDKSLKKLSQYSFLISPDFSLYREMPKALQVFNVFRNRWVAAYWQDRGLTVIPCISWSSPLSYEFCFESIEKGSTVAIGMIGCKQNNKKAFMHGYDAMIEKISPSHVIVFGTPYQDMHGNVISVDYLATRRTNRHGR